MGGPPIWAVYQNRRATEMGGTMGWVWHWDVRTTRTGGPSGMAGHRDGRATKTGGLMGQVGHWDRRDTVIRHSIFFFISTDSILSNTTFYFYPKLKFSYLINDKIKIE